MKQAHKHLSRCLASAHKTECDVSASVGTGNSNELLPLWEDKQRE